ncbi:MAG: GAF domain-containing protein [Chloroflexota bacterium]
MRTESIFSAIREINETLSLTNDEPKLLNTALDTLTQVLGVECGWVQTINARSHKLLLSARRGFSAEMEREMAAMDTSGSFGGVIGLGQKIVIPDLSCDGRYGLASFGEAGYRWLVAAPMMTYRNHGVLGVASYHKKQFKKETADLVIVIAGLLGTALMKARLFEKAPRRDRPDPAVSEKETPAPPAKAEKRPGKPPASDAFHRHAHRMESFRKGHS